MGMPFLRRKAVKIPDVAAGIIPWKIVWICVATKARDALYKCAGTALREVSLMLITVGRIIRASTSTAEIRLAPPVNW